MVFENFITSPWFLVGFITDSDGLTTGFPNLRTNAKPMIKTNDGEQWYLNWKNKHVVLG